MKMITCTVILLCLASVFVAAWVHPANYQWDFQVYYNAVKAYNRGLDPYETSNLKTNLPGSDIYLGYRYPLICLYLLAPLARFPYETAQHVWLLLKLVSVAGLLLIWRTYFLRKTEYTLMLLVAVFGFNAAMIWDLKAGNISVFEQLLLWSGLAFFCNRRLNLFAACVVVSALFKLGPAAFLLLLLLPAVGGRRNCLRAAINLLVLSALVLVPYLAYPFLFHSFISTFAGEEPRVGVNPSVMGIFGAASRHLPPGLENHRPLAWLVWFLFGGGLLFLSRPLLSRARASEDLRAPSRFS